jgi:preprotein translocase subunit SecA
MTEGVPLEAKLISRGIENAQKQVENHNFEIRKHLLEYDDVMNRQREVVYSQRRRILAGEALGDQVLTMFEAQVLKMADQFADGRTEPANWDWEAFSGEVYRIFGFTAASGDFETFTADALAQDIYDRAKAAFLARREELGPDLSDELVRWLLLHALDSQWRDHLLSMDRLKDGIGLRGYGQRDPLREYQREGFDLFSEMLERVRAESISLITHVQVKREEEVADLAPKSGSQRLTLSHGRENNEPEKPRPETRSAPKIGRNDPCPCGSGRKFKHCCGK